MRRLVSAHRYLQSVLILTLAILVVVSGSLSVTPPLPVQACNTCTFLLKWGSAGSGDGDFTVPLFVAVDPTSGNVYVTDQGNYRVEKFTSTGVFVGWAGGCTSGSNCVSGTSNGFTCTSSTCGASVSGSGDGQFGSSLQGVAVDSGGNVYVVDRTNNRVMKFTGGVFSGWAGKCTSGTNCLGGTHSNGFTCTAATCSGLAFGVGDGQFYAPIGVAVDSSGNVYVTDQYNERVENFTSTGVFVGWAGGCTGGVNCVGGTHSNGFTCTASTCTGVGTSGSGDGQFNLEEGVAVDSSGNVYVADYSNNRVEKFTSTGVFVGWAGGCTSGSNCVSGTSNGFSCTLATCGAPVSGSGNGQFHAPLGVGVDSGGNVYVADYSNSRLEKLTSTGTFLLAWRGSGVNALSSPYGVAVDSVGNVYVVDYPNSRVEKFGDPTVSITVTSSPTGSGFVIVDGIPAVTPAMFNWVPGSKHNLTASSNVGCGSGCRYLWVSWSDSGARSHNITASSPTTYTATFQQQLNNYCLLSSCVLRLYVGWNLISLPVVPVNTAIGNITSGLIAAGNFSVIWSFQGGVWKSFTPPSTGTLTTMQDGFGYWIYMIRPSTLLILGYTIPPPQGNPSKYTLSSGWNLVGFKPQSPSQNETVGAYLTTISGKYSIAGIYDNVNATWIVANPEVQLAPGEAMWIYMTAPATLVPPI